MEIRSNSPVFEPIGKQLGKRSRLAPSVSARQGMRTSLGGRSDHGQLGRGASLGDFAVASIRHVGVEWVTRYLLMQVRTVDVAAKVARTSHKVAYSLVAGR